MSHDQALKRRLEWWVFGCSKHSDNCYSSFLWPVLFFAIYLRSSAVDDSARAISVQQFCLFARYPRGFLAKFQNMAVVTRCDPDDSPARFDSWAATTFFCIANFLKIDLLCYIVISGLKKGSPGGEPLICLKLSCVELRRISIERLHFWRHRFAERTSVASELSDAIIRASDHAGHRPFGLGRRLVYLCNEVGHSVVTGLSVSARGVFRYKIMYWFVGHDSIPG